MKENLKTLSLIVIALSVFAIAVIDILKLTMPRDAATDEVPFPKNFIDRKNAPGPLQNAASENPATNQLLTDTTLTTIEFPEEIFNFGNIHEGDIVKHDFKFTNTGKNPLVIKTAKASCGCTIPSFNKEPIMPGKQGVISVQFNSDGKGGAQHKSIHVTANTIPNYTIIEITANVLDKK